MASAAVAKMSGIKRKLADVDGTTILPAAKRSKSDQSSCTTPQTLSAGEEVVNTKALSPNTDEKENDTPSPIPIPNPPSETSPNPEKDPESMVMDVESTTTTQVQCEQTNVQSANVNDINKVNDIELTANQSNESTKTEENSSKIESPSTTTVTTQNHTNDTAVSGDEAPNPPTVIDHAPSILPITPKSETAVSSNVVNDTSCNTESDPVPPIDPTDPIPSGNDEKSPSDPITENESNNKSVETFNNPKHEMDDNDKITVNDPNASNDTNSEFKDTEIQNVDNDSFPDEPKLKDSNCSINSNQSETEEIGKEKDVQKVKTVKRRKRFVADSDSEEEDDITTGTTSKFVGITLPDTADDDEEDEEEGDEDDDLDGFVVDDEDLEEEDLVIADGIHRDITNLDSMHSIHRNHNGRPRMLRRNDIDDDDDDDDDGDAFFDDIGDDEDSDDDRENNENENENENDDVYEDFIAIDDNQYNDNNDREEVEEDIDGPQRGGFHLIDDEAEEVDDPDIDEMEVLEEREELVDGEDIEESDGESLRSMDELDEAIYGKEMDQFSDLSFENAVKRQSLTDMIKIFEDGVDITTIPFLEEYPKFMESFKKKASKAMQLLSVLVPLGFVQGDQFKTIGLYDATRNELVERKENTEDPAVLEFVDLIQNEEYHRIPAILRDGVSPHEIPNFFHLMSQFQSGVIRKWFESIIADDVEKVKLYHSTIGMTVDIPIPRKLAKEILSTKTEDLYGSTGLIVAALVGSVSVARYLVENKAHIEFETEFGMESALMIAGRRGGDDNMEMVEYLCSVGADVNTTTTQSDAYANTESPLAFEALIRKQTKVLEYLTFFGADLYEYGPRNMSGEMVSVVKCCLLENGYGMEAMQSGLKRRFDLIKKCLNAMVPSDIDIVNNIAFVICDEFLNPLSPQFLKEVMDDE